MCLIIGLLPCLPMPSAEIIAVGTEILLGDIVDTNSQALGKLFASYGIEHRHRTTVGDNLERSSLAIREALSRADMVFTIGGLGPTMDDLTREAISHAVREPLEVDEGVLQDLRDYVAGRGAPWRESYAQQAMRPAKAICLPNESGTAPGIHWQREGKHVVALPGPRNEFLGMLAKSVEPIIASMSNSTIRSRTLRILGVPEAALGEMFSEEMRGENPTVSPYAKVGEVHLRISAKAKTTAEAEALMQPVLERITSNLGDSVYTTADDDLAKVVIDKLAAKRYSLAVAESCTGGLLAARFTSIPGSSFVFAGGLIAYSDMLKVDMLHVVPEDLEKFGAVSEEVARQMATNVRARCGTTYGLSVTGIAGPGGATEAKPVGLVYLGISSPAGTRVEECRFRGSREHIREISVQRSLALLWQELRS